MTIKFPFYTQVSGTTDSQFDTELLISGPEKKTKTKSPTNQISIFFCSFVCIWKNSFSKRYSKHFNGQKYTLKIYNKIKFNPDKLILYYNKNQNHRTTRKFSTIPNCEVQVYPVTERIKLERSQKIEEKKHSCNNSNHLGQIISMILSQLYSGNSNGNTYR